MQDTLAEFTNELNTLYLRVIKEEAMSNVLTRREYITDDLENDLKDSIKKYVTLLDDL